MVKEKEKENGNENEGEGEETITLTKAQYEALLDKLDEKEDDPADDGDDIDSLAKEGKKSPKEPEGDKDEVDLKSLDNEELFRFIDGAVRQGYIGPLVTKLEEIDLRLQIDHLTRPTEFGGKGFTDLFDYKEEIKKIGQANPDISMEDAYLLAKQKAGKKEEKKDSEKGSKAKELRHLPPLSSAKKGGGTTHSEKPGVSGSATKDGEPASLKEASRLAFDEVFGE